MKTSKTYLSYGERYAFSAIKNSEVYGGQSKYLLLADKQGAATALCVMGWRGTCPFPPSSPQKEMAGRDNKRIPRDPSRALVKGAIPAAGAPLIPAATTGHQ